MKTSRYLRQPFLWRSLWLHVSPLPRTAKGKRHMVTERRILTLVEIQTFIKRGRNTQRLVGIQILAARGGNKLIQLLNPRGWMGGGSNPTNWCNSLLSGFINNRGITGGYDKRFSNVSEQSKKDWKGHVEYNYHCTVTIWWDPLYRERTDPRCGTY